MGGLAGMVPAALMYVYAGKVIGDVASIATGARAPRNAAYYTLLGIETLSLRVAKAQGNVLALTRALAAHPAVATVHHPSEHTHPDHALAARDFPRGTGCVFSPVP